MAVSFSSLSTKTPNKDGFIDKFHQIIKGEIIVCTVNFFRHTKDANFSKYRYY